MLNKTLHTISQLNHLFDVGQEVYYSCLIIDYEWFDKTLSIDELIEPIQLKITRHKLYPDQLLTSDNILISKMKISNIVKKYAFHIDLEQDNDLKMTVFEDRKKQVHIFHESNKIIGYSKDEVELEFMKLVISTKRDMEYDKEETKLTKDETYELFSELYKEAVELYPEEVIKIHDSQKL